MIQIRRKKTEGKKKGEAVTAKERPEEEHPSLYVGAYPGKPWERLTNIRHGRGSTIKILTADEQRQVVLLAKRYFGFNGNDFPMARIKIQEALDDPSREVTVDFFKRAIFTEKRLIVRAYLSNASGRFIPHTKTLPLLKHIADAGLDFEVGAINYFIEGEIKTELAVGDATEVVSENGYWFAHTHPARIGVKNNILPSTKDMDVMILVARGLTQNMDRHKSESYVLRDIGATKIEIFTSIADRPASPKIEEIIIEYCLDFPKDDEIEAHLNTLKNHLITKYRLRREQIKIAQADNILNFLQTR